MANKTAMQQIIDWTKSMPGDAVRIEYLREKATELLYQEKNQILNAYVTGITRPDFSFEEYYENTYKITDK